MGFEHYQVQNLDADAITRLIDYGRFENYQVATMSAEDHY